MGRKRRRSLEDVGAASSLGVINSSQPLTQGQATVKKSRPSKAAALVQSDNQRIGVVNTSYVIPNAQGVSSVSAEELGRITSVTNTSNVNKRRASPVQVMKLML